MIYLIDPKELSISACTRLCKGVYYPMYGVCVTRYPEI